MTKGNYKFSNVQIIILIIIFLASSNFLGKYFYCIFLAFGLMIFISKIIRSDFIIFALNVLSALYIIIYPDSHISIMGALKRLAYPMCYLLGFNFMYLNKINDNNNVVVFSEKRIMAGILCVALGSFLHFFLNMLYHPVSDSRNTIDIWTGQPMAATGQALLGTMALAVFFTLSVCESNFHKKIIAIAGILAIYTYNFVLGGRTLILIGILLLLVSMLFFAMQKKTLNRFFLQILTVIFLFLFVSFLIKNNWFGVANFISTSNFGLRFTEQFFFEDTRIIIKKQYLELLFKFPFGGDFILSHVGMYAHDILLDVYNDIGIFGMISLVVFLLSSIREWIKTIKNNEHSDFFRLLLLSILISIMCVFFIEPVLAGSPWLFCSYCLLCGMISASNKQYNLMEESYK